MQEVLMHIALIFGNFNSSHYEKILFYFDVISTFSDKLYYN